jgi:2-methylcitrate dehydratase PrpD
MPPLLPLSVRLARLMRERHRAGVPSDIRRKVCVHIADSVGIALAATRGGPLAAQLIDAVSAGAGPGDCGVLGSPERRAPGLAAFANSALIHILDFDDIHDGARLHPTTTTLPVALAAATLVQAPASRIVDAVALGNELTCRLGVMCSPTGNGPGSDWFLTQLFGYMGATLAAAVVLDLDQDAMVSAFGMAYMQSAGGKEAGFGVGATARSIYPAFAAMGGMQAALLARAGIVGPRTGLDGDAGLFKLYLGGDITAHQTAVLLDRESWVFNDTQVKPWPCCRLSHPYVAAALNVRAKLNVHPKFDGAAVQRIVVKVNGSAAKLCRPLAERRRPQTLQDAKYSIPYMTAFTLHYGKIDLETLTGDVLAEAAVHALADRVEIEECLPDNPGHPPAEIDITTLDGRILHSDRRLALDMSDVMIKRKFASCLSYAGRADKSDLLWDRLMNLHHEKSAEFLFD